MRNKIFFMLAVIMKSSLCACGKQAAETITNTGEPSDNVSNINSETEIFENKDHWPYSVVNAAY